MSSLHTICTGQAKHVDYWTVVSEHQQYVVNYVMILIWICEVVMIYRHECI